MHFLRLLAMCWPCARSARDNHVLAFNFAKYSPFKKNFTHLLSNKPFLIWLLTTPPHLKYTATLSCNLSLMACFADINVSQGSVAIYARCGGMFNTTLTINLLRNLPSEKIVNRLRFDRIMVKRLWPRFLAHPVYLVRGAPLAANQPHASAAINRRDRQTDGHTLLRILCCQRQ